MGSPDGPSGQVPDQFMEQEPGESERLPASVASPSSPGLKSGGGQAEKPAFFLHPAPIPILRPNSYENPIFWGGLD